MPLSAEQRRAITKDLYCRIINHIMLIPLYNFFNSELPAPAAFDRDGATKRTLEIFKNIISDKIFEQGEPHELLKLWNTTINASMGVLERTHKPTIYQELKTALEQTNALVRKLIVSETSTLSVSEVITALEGNLKGMVSLKEVDQVPTSVDALLAYMALLSLPQSDIENRIEKVMRDIAQAKSSTTKNIIQVLTKSVTELLDDIKKLGETKLKGLSLMSDEQRSALEALKAKLSDPAGNLAGLTEAAAIFTAVEDLVKTAGQYITLVNSMLASQLNLQELNTFVQKQKSEKFTQEEKIDEYKSHLLVDVVEQAARDYCNKHKGQSALENTAIFVFTAVTIIKTLYGMTPLHKFKSWSILENDSNNITSLFKFSVRDQKDSNADTARTVRDSLVIPRVDVKQILEILRPVQETIEQKKVPPQSLVSSTFASSSSSSSSSSTSFVSLPLIPYTGGTAGFLASLEATYNIAVNTSVLNFVRQLRGVDFLSTIQTKYYGMFGGELTDKETLVEPIVAAYYGLVCAVNRQADRIATFRQDVMQKLKATSAGTKENRKLTAENIQLKIEQERLLKLIYLTTDLAVAAAFRSNQGDTGKTDVQNLTNALEALYWYELYNAYDFEKARDGIFKSPKPQSDYYCDLIKAKYPNFEIVSKDCSPLIVQHRAHLFENKNVAVLSEIDLRKRQLDHQVKITQEKAKQLETLLDLGVALKKACSEILNLIRQGKLGDNWEQEVNEKFSALQNTIREFLLGATAYPENKQIQDLTTFINSQFINNWAALMSDARGRYVTDLIAEFNTVLERLSAVKGVLSLENIGAFAADIAKAIDLRIKIGGITVSDNILQNYKPGNLDIFIKQKDDFLNEQVAVITNRVKTIQSVQIKNLKDAIETVTSIVADNTSTLSNSVASTAVVAPSPASKKTAKKQKREQAFAEAKTVYQQAKTAVEDLQNLVGKIKLHVEANQALHESLTQASDKLRKDWQGIPGLPGIDQSFTRMVIKVETDMALQQQQDSVRAEESIKTMDKHCDEMGRFVQVVCSGEIANIQDNHQQLNRLKLVVDKMKQDLLILCESLDSEIITNNWTAVYTKYSNLQSQVDEAFKIYNRYKGALAQLKQLTDKPSSEESGQHSVLELFTARINEFAASLALTNNLSLRKVTIEEFYKAFPPNIFSRLENVINVDHITSNNVDAAITTIKDYANTLVALLEGLQNFDKRLWSSRCDDLIKAFVHHYTINTADIEYLQTSPRSGVAAQEVIPASSDKILSLVESFAPLSPSSFTAAAANSSSSSYAGVTNAIRGGNKAAAGFATHAELDAIDAQMDELLDGTSCATAARAAIPPLTPTTERELKAAAHAVSRIHSVAASPVITPAKAGGRGAETTLDLEDMYDDAPAIAAVEGEDVKQKLVFGAE